MGQNGAVVGQIPFWPISLKKISKRGAKKVEIQPNVLFKPQDGLVSCRKSSVLIWDEKRPWLGRGGLICGNSMPKFELDFCPDHWGSPLDLKLHETSSSVN